MAAFDQSTHPPPRTGMSCTIAQVQVRAAAFIAEHLEELAREIVGWKAKGVRADGRLDDLAKIVGPLYGDDAVRMAADLATDAALNRVAGY